MVQMAGACVPHVYGEGPPSANRGLQRVYIGYLRCNRVSTAIGLGKQKTGLGNVKRPRLQPCESIPLAGEIAA